MNGKATILVADDDPKLVMILQRNLEQEGYIVITASDGREALRQIHQRLPDLIILDVMMPNMDGPETSERLRSDLRTRDIPIIFLTAILRKDEARSRNRKKNGFPVYVAKPYDIEEILSLVAALLEKYSATATGRSREGSGEQNHGG